MICKHDFHTIHEASKVRPNSASYHGAIGGITVGCVNCGQIRKVFTDGTVEIVNEGGKPIDEDHADHTEPR